MLIAPLPRGGCERVILYSAGSQPFHDPLNEDQLEWSFVKCWVCTKKSQWGNTIKGIIAIRSTSTEHDRTWKDLWTFPGKWRCANKNIFVLFCSINYYKEIKFWINSNLTWYCNNCCKTSEASLTRLL